MLPWRSSSHGAPRVRPSSARSLALTAYGLIILSAATDAATLSEPCRAIAIATPLASPRMAPAAARKPTFRTVRMRTSPATGAPALVKYGSSPAIGGACVAKYFSSLLRPSSALRPAPASTALLASACTAQRRSSPVGRLCCAGCQVALSSRMPCSCSRVASARVARSSNAPGFRISLRSFICPAQRLFQVCTQLYESVCSRRCSSGFRRDATLAIALRMVSPSVLVE